MAWNYFGISNTTRLMAYKQTFSEEAFRVETNHSLITVGDEVTIDCIALNSSFEIDLKWCLNNRTIDGTLNSMIWASIAELSFFKIPLRLIYRIYFQRIMDQKD